jgi:hypothetical protein
MGMRSVSNLLAPKPPILGALIFILAPKPPILGALNGQKFYESFHAAIVSLLF